MTKEMQPEALRLADELEQWAQDYAPTDFTQAMAEKSSAELRRLHACVQELEAALKKANGQAEHFEREWYLRGDKLEDLEAQLAAQRKPLKPNHPPGLTSINARISFDNGWRHCERTHGIGEVA